MLNGFSEFSFALYSAVHIYLNYFDIYLKRFVNKFCATEHWILT